MSHKRKISHGESPPSKRPDQAVSKFTDPPAIPKRFVYLATEEEYGPYIDTEQHVFEIYATVEDANNRLLARQIEDTPFDLKDWQTTYDEYGCLYSVAEDLDSNGFQLKVRRLEVKPPGSAPAVPVVLNRNPDENPDDEEYEDEEEEEDDEEEELHTRTPARAWTKMDSPFSDCDGCGCGGCQKCLSLWDL
ncbi:MAG: hypothetical protein Q9195_005518 [Heterodermia aff. obscurata]